jgi:hypothetical protein
MADVHQCRSCPWRVDCIPDQDIPNGYSVELHEGLRRTIATPGTLCGTATAMACHYSKPGEEFPCAGWLHHQLGVGNNIRLRLEVLMGRMPSPVVDGDQHQTFDDTLPQAVR